MTDQPAPDAPVVHEPARRRFVLRDAGAEAELVYRVDDGVMTLVHTGVPGPLEGRGLGGQLVRAALAHAVEQQWRIVPACPFARSWLTRHPADAAQVVILDAAPPSS